MDVASDSTAAGRNRVQTRGSRAAAQRIVEAVRRELQRSPYRSLRTVTCEYRQGVLTLRGRVRSFYLKQMAQTIARKIEGVRQTANCIEVEDRPAPSGQSGRRRS